MQNRKSNSVNGFTLLEMILAMLITAIVVASAYQIIFYLYKQWNTYNKHQSELFTLIQFEEVLSRDINACFCIKQQSKLVYDVILKDDTITYDFRQKISRKHKQIRDTFDITIGKITPKHLNSSTDSTLVSALKFEIISPLQLNANFIKHYTSHDLISIYPYGLE